MTPGSLLWHPFRARAEEAPERTALVAGADRLTYGELHARSNGVARLLVDAGVEPGDRVALFLPKGLDALVALFGILKAGAAYVPVASNQPAVRSATIIGDADVRAVVTEAAAWRSVAPSLSTDALAAVLWSGSAPEGIPDGVASATLADVDGITTAPDVAASADCPAYVLYTSGSTGVPKGVVLSHGNARAFADWGVETFSLGPDDRLSAHAPLTFDLSTFDFFAGLSSGASVHLVPARFRAFPGALADWIAAEALTTWYSVPTAISQMTERDPPPGHDFEHLRTMLFAGEVFPVARLRRAMGVFRHARFYNLFGPTETNVCTYYPVPRPFPGDADTVPIGSVCCGDVAEIRDDDGRALPDGEVGELVVCGPTVMQGYLNRPAINAERLTDPIPPFGTRAYKTGDMVWRDVDGLLYYSGRRDSMVKTRGYRVELGEVERALEAHDTVRQAAVVAVPDPTIGARLVAFVVPSEQPPSTADLLRHCAACLPRHALPESLHVLEDLPLTDRGKVDRQGLVADARSRA